MGSSTSGLPSLTFSPRGFHSLRGFSGTSSSSNNFGFGGSSSSSKSGDFGFKSFKFRATKPKGPTVQQALEAVFLHNKAHPHHSLLGTVLHDATHSVETGLDYLARPSYAIAAGTYDATKVPHHFDVGQFLHGLSQGIQGKDKKGFGQFLSEHGVLQHHGILRGIAGLGLDVATDPLSYVTAGASSAEAIAAKEAELGLSKGVLKDAIEKAQKGLFTSSQEALDAGKTLKSADLNATAGLARAHATFLREAERGVTPTYSSMARASALHGLEGLSHAEVKLLGPRMATVGYKLPFTKGFEVSTRMKAPSLLRTAEKQGFLGKFPGMAHGAEVVGKAFKPGWRNEKMHALEIMQKHVSELRQDHMAHLVQDTLIPPIKDLNLSETEMLHALKFGETTHGIVRMRPNRSERVLSLKVLKNAVRDGKISEKQAVFLKAWHDTTEALRKADAEYGVKYDAPLLNGAEKNVIYVPHVRELGSGLKAGFNGSLLAKKGFQYARKGESQVASLEKIAAEHPDVPLITHPFDMIARRAQAGAIKQSETWMADTVGKTFGIPTRLPNLGKQLQLGEHYRALDERLAKMKTLTPEGLAKTHLEAARLTEEERLASLEKAGQFHAQKELQLRRQISSLKGQITKAAKNRVPTSRQFLGMKNEDFSKLLKGMGKHPLSSPLRAARSRSKALEALNRQIDSSIRQAAYLQPKTGLTPHGSNYKLLIGNLLGKAQGVIRDDKLAGMRNAHLLSPLKRGESWEKRHSALLEDLRGEIKLSHQQNADDLQKAIDKHFGGRAKRKNLAYSLQAREKQLAKHKASWDAVEARIGARAANRLTQRQMAIHELQHKELTQAEAIGRAMSRIERQVEFHNTSVKNPEAFKAGYKVSHLMAPNGRPYALPAEMDEALAKSRQALNDDEFLQKFHNTWQKLVGKWKVGVTVVNPGYRVRNTLSDLWNAYISPKGGVPLWAMSVYGTKAAKLIASIRAAAKIDPAHWTVEQKRAMKMYVEMYHHGVLAGLFQGDIDKVRRLLEGTGASKDLLKSGHPLQALTKTATDFNRHAENWGRMMHYLYRREYQKMGAGEAADIVRGAHFDYEDLTRTEQAIKKSAVPFYTWTRKNIPYQIAQFARSGKYAAFPLMVNESNQASPKDPGQIVPSFVKQGLGFHVPFGGKGNFYLPVFGPVDLEKVQHPLSQGVSMLSPLLQIPTELITNKNLNTGQPIYGSELSHPRNPISGFAASILRGIPGTDVGQTSRQVNGKKMVGPGANPIVSYIAQQTPLTNLIVNAESNIKKAQRGGGQKALLSEFGGLSTYKPDQQQQQAIAQFEAQQSFKQYIRGLRDMGVLPEAKKRKASAYAQANNAAANLAFGGQ